MGGEQTDSASSHQNWVTKARAKRWASGKDWGSMAGGFLLLYLPVMVNLGKGGGPTEHKFPLYKAQGFSCWGRGAETTD